MPSSINSTSSSPGGLISSGATDNELVIQTGDTTAISIDASQNVGVAGDLTVSGTVSGTVDIDTVTGTLDVANGGTGATTLTANNVILGNGTSAVNFVAPGTNGNVLTSNGTTWTSATPAGGGVTSLNGQTGAITNTDVDSIGSYAFAVYQRTNPNSTGRFTYIAIGSTLAGSSLRYGSGADATNVATASLGADSMAPGGAFTNTGTAFPSGVGTLSALSGTWRKMAVRIDSNTTSGCIPQYRWIVGVWVRIS
jgi:hypothetical protein